MERAVEVVSAIDAVARAEGVAIALRHVCLACADLVRAKGVGLSLVSPQGLGEPLYATGAASEKVMEAQVTFGEGPSVDALAECRPVLASDLTPAASVRRWPGFAPEAVACGTVAVFAFPLVLGAISVGVLEVHRGVAGSLPAAGLANALLFGDASIVRVLEHLDGHGGAESGGVFEYRWAEVHQATGIVSVQLETGLTEALLRLRAHAFHTGRRLSDVAHDVVAGGLSFES